MTEPTGSIAHDNQVLQDIIDQLSDKSVPAVDLGEIVALSVIGLQLERIANALEWRNKTDREKIETRLSEDQIGYKGLQAILWHAQLVYGFRKVAAADFGESDTASDYMRKYYLDRYSEAEKALEGARSLLKSYRRTHFDPELRAWIDVQDADFYALHPELKTPEPTDAV